MNVTSRHVLLVRPCDIFLVGVQVIVRDVVPYFSAENLATLLHAVLPTWIRISAFISVLSNGSYVPFWRLTSPVSVFFLRNLNTIYLNF
jgi:hypothetical protein